MAQITKPLVFYIPDTRGVEASRYGKGNLKIGLGVYTYSRLPGLPGREALGTVDAQRNATPFSDNVGPSGTCPGATEECLRICYAARPVTEDGPVAAMWTTNSGRDDVPEIPEDATHLRLHISGDFDTPQYIVNWIKRIHARPDVTVWAYTKSWRVARLLPFLEGLRELPNVQLFASMDKSMPDAPPDGWRRAWIDGDPRGGQPLLMRAHGIEVISNHNLVTENGVRSYVCPEETKRQPNCQTCRYCFDGKRNDVTFLEH